MERAAALPARHGTRGPGGSNELSGFLLSRCSPCEPQTAVADMRDMNEAESQALELAQDAALDQYGPSHRFTAKDLRALHRLWLGPIYPWSGDYRSVNIGKGGFQFAHAPRIAGLMSDLERGPLRRYTPCGAYARPAYGIAGRTTASGFQSLGRSW
jgi:hypothetical protein